MLAYGEPPAEAHRDFYKPAEVGANHEWFVAENRAVLAAGGPRDSTSLSTFDAARIQLLEYITLERAALRSVQRGTQLVIAEGVTTTRRQLQRWQRLVAATTDEYVLHDEAGVKLESLREHIRHHPTTRDPGALEAQVHRNLATFQSLIDAASDRVLILLSTLFGVVAALSLASVVRLIAHGAFGVGGPTTDFENRHVTLSILIDVGVILVLAVVSFVVMRRANRLRPPRARGRGPRA